MEIKTSTGGTITKTKTGLIHKAGEGAYSGRVAELGIECKVVDRVKRGRGRPPKVSQSGAPYETKAVFESLFGTPKFPKIWKGTKLVHSKPE